MSTKEYYSAMRMKTILPFETTKINYMHFCWNENGCSHYRNKSGDFQKIKNRNVYKKTTYC